VRRHHRRFAFALALSITAHVALFTLTKIKTPELVLAGSAPQQAMTVRLIDVEPAAPAAAPAPSQAQPPPTPQPPRPPVPVPPLPLPRIVRKSPTAVEPEPPQPQPPQPRPPPIPELDMAAMIEARQAQRRAAQAAAPRSQMEPTPDQLAQANINRNLRIDRGEGVGGVFEILRKGTRTAEFAFNGWRPDTERRWRETIEVDAGQGGDVERAIVRRMIELIRGHYNGDFRWESHVLGRVVVLSARPEDQDGLEEFLVREFFGQPTTGRGR
jgi:outer membrane biosynthesis protein TonB